MSDDSGVETVEPAEQTDEMEPVEPKGRFRFPVLEILLTLAMISAAMSVGINIGMKIHTDSHSGSGVDLFRATATDVAKQTKVSYRVVTASKHGMATPLANFDEITLSSDEGLVVEVKNPLEDCRIGFCVFPKDAMHIQESNDGKFGLTVDEGFEDCLGIVVILDSSMKVIEGAVIFRIKPTLKAEEVESTI